MVQILPQEQGLGELLGGGLGAGIQTGLQGLLNQFQQQKSAENLGKVLGLKEDELKSFSKLAPEQQKIVADIIKQQQKLIATSPELLKKEKLTRYGNVANQIENLMQGGLKSRTPLTSSGREKAAEINSLGEQMFAAVRDDLIKGNMNQKVFDFIKNRVTVNALDTDATIKGKLKAFRQIIGMSDYSNLSENDAKKIINTNIKEEKKELGEKEYGKGTGLQMIAILPPNSKIPVWVPPEEVENALKQGGKRVRGLIYK